MNEFYAFSDAKAQMIKELKQLEEIQTQSCYKEPVVKRIEIPVSDIDLLSWLCQQKETIKIYGSHQSGLYAIAGVGAALMVEGDTIESYEKIDRMFIVVQVSC